jgi:hypothetical protein
VNTSHARHVAFGAVIVVLEAWGMCSESCSIGFDLSVELLWRDSIRCVHAYGLNWLCTLAFEWMVCTRLPKRSPSVRNDREKGRSECDYVIVSHSRVLTTATAHGPWPVCVTSLCV